MFPLTDDELLTKKLDLMNAKTELIQLRQNAKDADVINLIEQKLADTVSAIIHIDNVIYMRTHNPFDSPPRLQNCGEC